MPCRWCIDLQVKVPLVDSRELSSGAAAEKSETIRRRVAEIPPSNPLTFSHRSRSFRKLIENEEIHRHRIAWIPWVLAVIALFGINALHRDESSVRRNDTVDGIGLSVAAKDLWTTGRVMDPLVLGPPSPPTNTVFLTPGSTFLKLEAGKNPDPASLLHGVARGRAPPHFA